MKKDAKPKTVVMAPWLAGSPGRKHLQGALRYANAGRNWNVKILSGPKEFTAEVIRAAEESGVDGFLACVDSAAAAALADSQIPTVLLDFPPPVLRKRQHALTLMFNDEEGIGAKGADYLLSLGSFATYAFVPDAEGRGWSRLRERGFKDTLRKQGKDVRVFGPTQGTLADWLAALPKPAAVMSAWDFGAKEVLEACRRAKLKVPADVSVLGADNDELLCEYAQPTLTSINIDHEQHGYESATILDRMMNARKPSAVRKVFTPVGEVVERESTKPTAPAENLVRRALDFIDANATAGIGVGDVVAHLAVSRRLADLRFSQATGMSIRRAIENRRLEEVKRRLANTTMPIDRVARLSGYTNPQRLKYVFKSRMGLTMSNWRKQAKASAAAIVISPWS